ncbi:MAG TPA: TetR family transcriptional regulator [Parvibaculum sp.]|jgi:TetR/AcrR family transcriptional regulator
MARATTQVRNPETTRAGILEAAETSFTAKGFAGTSMRDIAEAAGIHQSLIHHYFGTKQALWQAVVERYVEAYLDRQLPHLEDGKLDAATLPRALEIEFEFWRDNPNLLRLQNWALLEGSNPFGEKRDALYAPFIPVMEALQKAGFIRADIEPFHALVMAAASVGFWLQNRDEIAAALKHDPAAAKAADDRFFADMMKVFFDGGIAARRG